MRTVTFDNCTLHRGDCRPFLAEMADAAVDVAITDPPYGIGADRLQAARAKLKATRSWWPSRDYGGTRWDSAAPDRKTFDELRRVSRHQVIFGGQYFADRLPVSRSWIVWDKDNGRSTYADCELAWTSFDRPVRKLRWRWHGMLQEKGQPRERRIHPTQKPLGLMLWVIEHYTRPGDLVLDPFLGSGATAIACLRLGRRFVGVEREEAYFRAAVRRIRAELPRKEAA